MNNPVIPTVGRIVYFTPASNNSIEIVPDFSTGVCAAMVTAVHNPNCVNLAVFDANGQVHQRHSVCHISTVPTAMDSFNHYDSWDWMPYQKGQAARTEHLEAKLVNESAEETQDERMEAEIKQLGLTAPRVPKEHIDHLMNQVTYKTHIVEGTTTTVAVAVLSIGDTDFTLAVESTACVDKANFNAAYGAKYAIEKAAESARNKLWELEGYVLALCLLNNAQCAEPEQPLPAEPVSPFTPYQQRVIQELTELRERLAKLTEMLSLPQPAFIDDAEWERLQRQQEAMSNYGLVLAERVQNFMVSISLAEPFSPNNTVNS